MGITFNADEIFRMAEQAEANAARFYRRAAQLHGGADRDVAFLERMAEMEDAHRETFASMRVALAERLREATAADPDGEAALYLQHVADTHGEGDTSATEALTGTESLEDLLRTGVRKEEEAVAFYERMRDLVPEKLGRRKIDTIIAEERHHADILAAELERAGG